MQGTARPKIRRIKLERDLEEDLRSKGMARMGNRSPGVNRLALGSPKNVCIRVARNIIVLGASVGIVPIQHHNTRLKLSLPQRDKRTMPMQTLHLLRPLLHPPFLLPVCPSPDLPVVLMLSF